MKINMIQNIIPYAGYVQNFHISFNYHLLLIKIKSVAINKEDLNIIWMQQFAIEMSCWKTKKIKYDLSVEAPLI